MKCRKRILWTQTEKCSAGLSSATAEAWVMYGQCEVGVARILYRVAKLGSELYLFSTESQSWALNCTYSLP
jgi:hypothetical protein